MATAQRTSKDDTENYDIMTIELNPERTRRALVVGGGPVGALTALSLEKRGWNVELWEARDGEYLPWAVFVPLGCGPGSW